MSVLRQTNLTLVAAHDSGHDPLKASGLLLAHLPWICSKTTPDQGQYWRLSTRNQPAKEPWEALERIAVVRLLPSRYRLPTLVLDATGMRIGELEALTLGRHG
jgi:integrase